MLTKGGLNAVLLLTTIWNKWSICIWKSF